MNKGICLFAIIVFYTVAPCRIHSGIDTISLNDGGFDFSEGMCSLDGDLDITPIVPLDPTIFIWARQTDAICIIYGAAFESIAVAPDTGCQQHIRIGSSIPGSNILNLVFVVMTEERCYAKCKIIGLFEAAITIQWEYQDDGTRYFKKTPALWNVHVSNMLHMERERTIVYYMEGDTLLGEKEYWKLYWIENDADAQGLTPYAYLREDSLGRTYAAFNESTETMLYDFGNGPGDTVRYDYWVYPWQPLEYRPGSEFDVVTSVDSVLLNDGWHIRQTMQYNSVRIQGVGDIRGLFGPIQEYPSDGSSFELIYFERAGKAVYPLNTRIDQRAMNTPGYTQRIHTYEIFNIQGVPVDIASNRELPTGIYIQFDAESGRAELMKVVR